MKDRPVKVTWLDASSHATGWTSRKNAAAFKPYLVETVGWLLRNDKRAVVVAQGRSVETDQFTETMDIPRGMVRSIKTLR